MDKLLPLLTVIATASIAIGRPAAAEWRLAGPLSNPSATDTDGFGAAVVLVAGKGGGMGGGATTGGMGGGATTGGMGGGGTGGGMFSSGPNFGTSGNSGWPGNPVQPSYYYTYQCATPVGVCSFVAPAALRSSSLRAGARCACTAGQPEGQIR